MSAAQRVAQMHLRDVEVGDAPDLTCKGMAELDRQRGGWEQSLRGLIRRRHQDPFAGWLDTVLPQVGLHDVS